MRQLLLIFIMLFLVGCGKIKIIPNISSLSQKITTNAEDIKTANTIISSNTKESIILNSSQSIDKSVVKLKINIKELKKIEKGVGQLVKERDKAISDKNSIINRTLSWLIVITIVMTGVFGVLFFLHGNKLGLSGAAISIVVCAMCIFIQMYYIYIVIFGAFILIILIGLIIYNIFIQRKAFSQVVQSFETVKTGDYKDRVNDIQSLRTRKLVDIEKK